MLLDLFWFWFSTSCPSLEETKGNFIVTYIINIFVTVNNYDSEELSFYKCIYIIGTYIKILQFIFIYKYSFYNEYIQFFLNFGDQIQSGPQFGSYFHPDFQPFGQMIMTYKHLYLILMQ